MSVACAKCGLQFGGIPGPLCGYCVQAASQEERFPIGKPVPDYSAEDFVQTGHDTWEPRSPKDALSPDAPMEATPQGGRHSVTGTAFHHLDPDLMLQLAMILYKGGAKYGRNNWLHIPVEDHLNHALTHIFGYMSGDLQDDHILHAILRLMFAEVVGREGENYAAAS